MKQAHIYFKLALPFNPALMVNYYDDLPGLVLDLPSLVLDPPSLVLDPRLFKPDCPKE